MTEQIKFSADISQLMNLIINAFYSKNEIFLRELLSNSSDALEKIRFESLTDKSSLDSTQDLKIMISVNRDNGELLIEDTGIGMTRDDLVNNLGTIAKSGTRQFIEQIKQQNKSNENSLEQIGQFGVGFYSSFLVADNVKIYTKHNNEKELIWESTSDESYTITENPEPVLKRGTRIVLKIKETQKEFLETTRIKEVIHQYMQFINYPIEILETKTETYEEPIEQEETENQEEKDEPEIEEVKEENQEEKPTTKTVTREVDTWSVVNNMKPIWTRKACDISDNEYNNFFKSITTNGMTSNDPISYKHFSVEGETDIKSILYIPDKEMNMFGGGDNQREHNIKLYVKKVFIKNNVEGLVPEWLNFMVGVVDSDNIPLNVSRELLQQNKVISIINKVIVKKSIELFQELADNDDNKYNKFYDNYSKMLKLGIHEDNKNRERLMPLLRFHSIKHEDKYISFNDYVSEMDASQNNIYYITGANIQSIKNSPFIETFKQRNIDVLFFVDAIDEYMLQQITQFNDKQLVNIAKDGIKFDEENIKQKTEEYASLIKYFKDSLGSQVQDVKISDRLTTTPCMLSSAEFGWTANMERIMKAQALRNTQMDQFMGARKILEINLEHKLIKQVNSKIGDENNDKNLKNIIQLLYDTALLNSGFTLEKPSEYATRVNDMLTAGFCDEEDDIIEDDNSAINIKDEETVECGEVENLEEVD